MYNIRKYIEENRAEIFLLLLLVVFLMLAVGGFQRIDFAAIASKRVADASLGELFLAIFAACLAAKWAKE